MMMPFISGVFLIFLGGASVAIQRFMVFIMRLGMVLVFPHASIQKVSFLHSVECQALLDFHDAGSFIVVLKSSQAAAP